MVGNLLAVSSKTDQTCFQRWPQYSVKTVKELPHSLPTSSDLTRHLIHKEIVSTSLLKFDDHAGHGKHLLRELLNILT